MGRAAWKTLPPLSTCLAFAIRHTEPLEKIKYKTRLAKRGRQVGAVCVCEVCVVCVGVCRHRIAVHAWNSICDKLRMRLEFD